MNSQATIESLLEEFDDLIENGVKLPLTGGKVLINVNDAKSLLDELKEVIPDEIRKARNIIADRDEIIEKAHSDSNTILKITEEKVKAMVNQDEIVRRAQAQANEEMAKGQAKYREMRKAANEYIDDILRRAELSVSDTLSELKRTKQNIQSVQKNT